MPASGLRHFFFLLLLFFFFFHGINVSFAASPSTEFIYPNFTMSSLLFYNYGGIFLLSPSGEFVAGIINPTGQLYQEYNLLYLCVLHRPTKTVIWMANRSHSMGNSGNVMLTTAGITISVVADGSIVWSTPPFSSAVSALRLLDNGNLMLLDASNATLWQSFDSPADTMISGQLIRVGTSLTAWFNDSDPAVGDYSLTVTGDDALATWGNTIQRYWSLSTDPRASKVSQGIVDYMTANSTGIYLVSSTGQVLSAISLPPAYLHFIKLDSTGQLHVSSYSTANNLTGAVDVLVAPTNKCNVPLYCSFLGLCTAEGNVSTCSCPPPLVASPAGGCAPSDGSKTPASSNLTCNGSQNSSASYISLGSGISYFGIQFARPITSAGDTAVCRELCSSNCSCLAFFYENSSKSCYLIDDRLGSLLSRTWNGSESTVLYIKSLVSQTSLFKTITSSTRRLILILSFFLVIIVMILMVIMLRRRTKSPRLKKIPTDQLTLGRRSNANSAYASDKFRRNFNYGIDEPENEEDDIISELIPGLPTRFAFAELEAATNNFRTKVGSGGFGSVYKGELPDQSAVAVKKITNIGVQGKREFCTEISIIGNIHHVNLVRLRGFCAHGGKRLLVYEFMNRGSLDRSLFGAGQPLEWQERLDIAIGAARGLAYLHSYCNPKIIHCDVKPENILLHEGGQVKIADFGLAKLLSTEQSGLFTTMRGTRGYLAPEWLSNSAVTDRTDVYSFGMVLLELVRGRKNRSPKTDGDNATSAESNDTCGMLKKATYFPLAALQKHEEGNYLELADPRLEGRARKDEVGRMVKVALCCLHEEPPLRPTMITVAAMLEGSLDVWEPRVESLGFLRLYGKRFVDPMNSGGSAGNKEKGQVTGSNGSEWSLNLPASSSSSSIIQSYYNPSQQQISGPR